MMSKSKNPADKFRGLILSLQEKDREVLDLIGAGEDSGHEYGSCKRLGKLNAPVRLLATADEAWRYPDYLRAGQQLPVWPSDRVIEIIPQMSDYLEEFR
jgi:hypothetical protein